MSLSFLEHDDLPSKLIGGGYNERTLSGSPLRDFFSTPNTSDLTNEVVRNWNLTTLQRWGASKGFLASTAYSIADGVWVTAATFVKPFIGVVNHLDGRPTVG